MDLNFRGTHKVPVFADFIVRVYIFADWPSTAIYIGLLTCSVTTLLPSMTASW